jgi:hypothetical protein
MSLWGVVCDADDALLHVIPVADDGQILRPHTASMWCTCRPLPDEEVPDQLLVHQDRERGGTNA